MCAVLQNTPCAKVYHPLPAVASRSDAALDDDDADVDNTMTPRNPRQARLLMLRAWGTLGRNEQVTREDTAVAALCITACMRQPLEAPQHVRVSVICY